LLHRAKVLLIDDDQDMRWAMRNILADAAFNVVEAETGAHGLELAACRAPDIVLLDMRMPDVSGDEVLRRLQILDAGLPVIVVTAHGSIAGAVTAIRDGAFEYITKPFQNSHLVSTVQRAIARRNAGRAKAGNGISATLAGIMGPGQAVQKLAEQIEAVAATDYSVVIQGETGTGKEVVARCLHQFSRRAARPLIVVDCGALTETLTGNAFFGHERGAFTGAVDRRHGYFEGAANGGTIFLDEIGNLAMTGQKALLRTIEQRTIQRVGGTDTIDIDMRVIAATNDDLTARSKAGAFREDLYFRLTEYVIKVPPLRSRPEDIPFLATRFLTQARQSLGRAPADLEPNAVDLLRAYAWPGNVRELRNIMRRVALAATGRAVVSLLAESLNAADVPAALAQTGAAETAACAPRSLRHLVLDQVRAVERDAVVGALGRAGGNKASAARLLGIDYKTYRKKLKLLGAPPVAPANA
jgi:DNA-binding NtrC family response regulator